MNVFKPYECIVGNREPTASREFNKEQVEILISLGKKQVAEWVIEFLRHDPLLNWRSLRKVNRAWWEYVKEIATRTKVQYCDRDLKHAELSLPPRLQ